MSIIDILRIPETRRIIDFDDISTTLLHKKIIREKKCLKEIYIKFYNCFRKTIQNRFPGEVLVEIGSGGGFLKELLPNIITSDVCKLPSMDLIFSALNMPFQDESVDAFFMVDVFHHLPDVIEFFKEATRCLRNGGKIVMIEPANTLWGGFIWRYLHHETFDPKASWKLGGTNPMSSANGALPWIVFSRDRKIFNNMFPSLKITEIIHHTPFRYLFTGGVSMRQLVPSFLFYLIETMEAVLSPMNSYFGMFHTIKLEKVINRIS